MWILFLLILLLVVYWKNIECLNITKTRIKPDTGDGGGCIEGLYIPDNFNLDSNYLKCLAASHVESNLTGSQYEENVSICDELNPEFIL